MNTLHRFAWVQSEGHDSFGAFELTLGCAVLLGCPLFVVLCKMPWLAWAVFCGLLIAVLWGGHRLESRYLRMLGRRRSRGTLLLRITWLVLAWALLWTYLLIRLAHARAWNWLLPGWADGPIMLMLVLGLYYLAIGVKVGVRRWVVLGLTLSMMAVLIPGLSLLRDMLYLSTGLFAGGALLISGYRGQQVFWERRRTAGL